MWAANRDPQRDADNLEDLASQIFRSRSRKVVLISTVAVFDRSDAGYTESKSSYETQKAYGKNRRWLEEALASEVSDLHVLRLPALFGPGLKKNFIFDLINPVPSFIAVDKFESVSRELSPGERELLGRWFVRDDQLNMHKYDRDGATRSGESRLLESVFSRIGFEAKTFTNSESRYQYYNVERLNDDIDTCIRGGLGVVNICSEPLSAKDICKQLFGVDFLNRAPPLVSEDVRSEHANLFGGEGDYMFDQRQVLAELELFVRSGG